MKYIFNYNACVISNISNGYIHLYWTKPLNFASYDKCMGRCSIESKNDGGNIISSLQLFIIGMLHVLHLVSLTFSREYNMQKFRHMSIF